MKIENVKKGLEKKICNKMTKCNKKENNAVKQKKIHQHGKKFQQNKLNKDATKSIFCVKRNTFTNLIPRQMNDLHRVHSKINENTSFCFRK